MECDRCYIYHSTNIDNLMQIISEKVLYANKYIKEEYRRMSTTEESIYVFTSLCHPDGKLQDNFGPCLMFSSDGCLN